MLDGDKAFSGFAVPDIDAARAFYGATLGLDIRDAGETGLLELHVGGGAPTMIYPKPDHVPATYTILNFPVDDIDASVDELVAAGISMERYPDASQDERGISRDDRGPAIAWFKDPAGNILSVLKT
ncbi:MAG: VOC family protein [Chloroflexota bacterium]